LSTTATSEQAEAIREQALRLGFDRIGFAPALPPAHAGEFRLWLSEGKAGTMTYLNRSADKRCDPGLVLAGAQTIVSVAQSYFSGHLPEEIRNDPSCGLIASYAWGRDYHHSLLKKLAELAGFISSLQSPASNLPLALSPYPLSLSYVDTGPILEREHAARAGLGFIGKNTLLIAPRMGSTIILGEILTTLEIPPSPIAKMPSCGSCTRCLDICPTHAFPTAFILDSTLCISYLTIEYKGIIPRDLRAKMGNHIFGCADCKDCCPWNQRFSQETQEEAYRAAIERQAPLLADLARLSEEGFRAKFAGSPVLRPGYVGFLRNVAVALGNWGTLAALQALEPLLMHSSPLVRLHAAWAAGQIHSPEAQARLKRMSESEREDSVQTEILSIL
jgi:epoxyqueuosine reductase